MNQTEQMCELCPTCGESEPRTGNCGTSDNDNRALCKKSLVAKPEKLVRLSREEIYEIWPSEVYAFSQEAVDFAQAIMDKMEQLNGGNKNE